MAQGIVRHRLVMLPRGRGYATACGILLVDEHDFNVFDDAETGRDVYASFTEECNCKECEAIREGES